MPEDKCELLSKCGFFNNFQKNSIAVKEGWIRMFCNDQIKAETCKRKKIRRETGSPPPDNMSPTGVML